MNKASQKTSAALLIGCILLAFFAAPRLWGQTAASSTSTANTSTTQSLGLGVTRFNSGYSPITLDRPNITPGQPFNIRPTMDSLVSGTGKSGSFGGLLRRYDMTGFGRIFNTRAASAALAASLSRNLPPPADTTVVNISDEPRMYPPRLKTDPDDFPPYDLNSPEKRRDIDFCVQGILDRYPLAPKDSLTINADGDRLILHGQIRSKRTIEALASGLGLVPGVFAVDNQIEYVEDPEAEERPKDPLGYEQ